MLIQVSNNLLSIHHSADFLIWISYVSWLSIYFFKQKFIESLWVLYHAPSPTHLPIPLYLIFTLATSSPKENKQTSKQILPWKLLCVMVCTQNPLWAKQLYLKISIAIKYWSGSKASCFNSTINTKSSPGCFLGILLLPSVTEILVHTLTAYSHALGVHGWDRCWYRPTQSPESGPRW